MDGDAVEGLDDEGGDGGDGDAYAGVLGLQWIFCMP